MSQPRRTAALMADTLCRIVGRRQVVRAARYTLNRARLDLPNEPTTNGEYDVQRWVLGATAPNQPVTVFDIGANVGDWSRAMLDQAVRTGHADNVALHVFEPDGYAHSRLSTQLPSGVRINRLAVSDRTGPLTFYTVAPGAGTNSAYATSTGHVASTAENVIATTIDEYRRVNDIGRINLAKIDTEGHDFLVLVGAEVSLRNQAIDMVQFEYNHRWVYARHFLKDVFDLVVPYGYVVGKVTPHGIEVYPHWDPDLETFVEGNYLACTAQLAHRLRQIPWWKC
jgi:FkbM family methyltransferase